MSVRVLLPNAFQKHTNNVREIASTAANLPELVSRNRGHVSRAPPASARRRRPGSPLHQLLRQRRRHPLPRQREVQLQGRRRSARHSVHRRRLLLTTHHAVHTRLSRAESLFCCTRVTTGSKYLQRICSSFTVLLQTSRDTAPVSMHSGQLSLISTFPGSTTTVEIPASTLLPAAPARPHIHAEVGKYRVRLAQSVEDRDAACRLRFKVFNIEMGEGLETSYQTGLDTDQFD